MSITWLTSMPYNTHHNPVAQFARVGRGFPTSEYWTLAVCKFDLQGQEQNRNSGLPYLLNLSLNTVLSPVVT